MLLLSNGRRCIFRLESITLQAPMPKPRNGKRIAPTEPGAGIFGGPLEDATLLPSAVGAVSVQIAGPAWKLMYSSVDEKLCWRQQADRIRTAYYSSARLRCFRRSRGVWPSLERG